jgi:hypothetical protein
LPWVHILLGAEMYGNEDIVIGSSEGNTFAPAQLFLLLLLFNLVHYCLIGEDLIERVFIEQD